MIHITKNTEPMTYRRYCSNHDAAFDNMDSPVKLSLKKRLLEEQGSLCAYCMSRINLSNMKVEHYVPRSAINDLVYSNLLAVCKGNEGKGPLEQTCDTQKGNQLLTLNPQNPLHMQTIKYSRNGTISSENLAWNSEINNILNLNCKKGHLINERRRTLDAFKEVLSKQYKHDFKKVPLSKMLNNYINKKNTGPYPPYVGIIIWYLQDRISRCNNQC